jgi:hypothetical protein
VTLVRQARLGRKRPAPCEDRLSWGGILLLGCNADPTHVCTTTTRRESDSIHILFGGRLKLTHASNGDDVSADRPKGIRRDLEDAHNIMPLKKQQAGSAHSPRTPFSKASLW